MNNIFFNKKKMRYLKILLAVQLIHTNSAFAKSTPKRPLSGEIKSSIKDYKSCRRQAIKQPAKDRRKAASECKDQYPGAESYIACKKKAVKTSKGNNRKLDEELKICEQVLRSLSFDDNEALPFLMNEGKIIFAGVSLHKKQKYKELNIRNFDCTEIDKAIEDEKKAEYLLFGNAPQNFEKFRGKKDSDLIEKFQRSWQKQDGKYFDIPNLGQVYMQAKKDLGPLYLPSAKCSFSANTGSLVTAISIYFLINRQTFALTPYFGTIFYAAANQLESGNVAQDLSSKLGKSYRVTSNAEGVMFISSTEISEFDKEGDPVNVCKKPRRHNYIGIVKPGENSVPNYAIIANISNLCRFGDEMSSVYL